jgi:hypothetical protein
MLIGMPCARAAFVPATAPGAIAAAIETLGAPEGWSVGLFVAERDAPDLGELVRCLRATGRTFFGGLFPYVVDGRTLHDRGVLIAALPLLGKPVLVTGMDQPSLVMPDLLPFLRGHAGKPTAFVIVDGLAPNLSRLLGATFHQLGDRVSYWGGGAGSLTLEPRPCVFTEDGVFANAGVLAFSSLRAGLGVQHGWRELRGPFVATKTRGNVIHQLNWKTALGAYQQAVESDSGIAITRETFFRATSAYPFGIRKQGHEFVVRDPIAFGDDGSLTCVGDVPENAVLWILKGSPQHLIDAATRAARDARPLDCTTVRHCLLADCVSRVLFLGDRFADELEALEQGLGELSRHVPLVGVLTLGEISSDGRGYVELFNKTCVMAVTHEV